MEWTLVLLQRLGQAVVGLLLNPFYYISLLIVVWQMHRQIYFERKCYHSRIHYLFRETWRIALWGLLAGATLSLAMGAFGASIMPQTILYLWLGVLLLALIRVRFLCFAYIIGLLGAIHAIITQVPFVSANLQSLPAADRWLSPLTHIHMPSLLLLVGLLHLAEALLIRVQGERLAMPVFIQGKRGKIVGSYQFQGLWPVPLLMLVPATHGSSAGQAPWLFDPLFGGADMWSGGWMFMALPMMIGFSDMTVSRTPRQKAKESATRLLIYGALLTLAAVVSELWHFFILPASLLAVILHEVMIWLARREEDNRSPLYVHSQRGLRVLAVLPNSAAQSIGIQPGELIHKVNGKLVRSKEELHQAIQLNAAFTRLEIIDLRGEHRFAQRALFEGEHHQLGIILAPDDDAEYYVIPKKINKFRKLRSSLARQSRTSEQTVTE